MTFKELKLKPQLLEAISYFGFENATPVQELVIPFIMQDRDVIACAQTGTGKTAAFVLPVLNKLIDKDDNGIDTLIIVPTRELAMQIDQQIQGFSYFIPAGSVAIYGGGDGKDWDMQKSALKEGADIIVATPGKLLSHLKTGHINLKNLRHLILDEADRMLDMGFIDDIKAIMNYLPPKRQNLMFSATMPHSIRQLAKKVLSNPAEVSLAISKPAEGVVQKAILLYESQKNDVLKSILEERAHYESILIFSSTKSKINDIVRALVKNGFAATGISSNLEQTAREEVLRNFTARQIRILVATDVMSRGIDVKDINMVVNYDVPHDAEDYVHRVGRTARVNTKGEAITFVTPADMHKITSIEKLTGINIPKEQASGNADSYPSWSDKPKFRGTNSRTFQKRK